MGVESYVGHVLDILDPQQQILGIPPAKVKCRAERGEVFKKSIADILPNREDWKHAIIIDDREDAWDHESRDHILQVPAFYYFDTVLEGLTGVLPYISSVGRNLELLSSCLNIRRVSITQCAGACCECVAQLAEADGL